MSPLEPEDWGWCDRCNMLIQTGRAGDPCARCAAVGSHTALSKMPAPSLRAKLADGKYTRWMARLPAFDTQLHGLLWLVGEFAARTSPSQYVVAEQIGGFRRREGALRAIANFSKHPMTIDQVRLYIRRCIHDPESIDCGDGEEFPLQLDAQLDDSEEGR